MTGEFLPPSIDPGQRKSIPGTLEFIKTKMLQDVDDMLPAKVVVYDRVKNRASVQIQVNMVDTTGKNVIRAQIASIPVLQLGGGGFVISFPLVQGDLGWIKATDVDMSLFLQGLSLSPPNTRQLHKFDSAMFIPDTMFKDVIINSEDAANVVLQTIDGTCRVAIWPDRVKVTAPLVDVVCTNATVEASTSITMTSPQITLLASTNITLDSPTVTITGELTSGTGAGGTATFNGPIIADQTITASGDVVSGSISLQHHIHPVGSGDTGEPVP